MSRRLGARLAKAGCLGLSSSLGERLGVGGEVDGEPEPDRDLELEARRPADLTRRAAGQTEQIREEDHGYEGGRDFDDEHDRVAHHLARVELAQCRDESPTEHLRVEDATVPWRAGGAGLARFAGYAAAAAGGIDYRQAAYLAAEAARGFEGHQKSLPALLRSWSAIGPRASAGKKVSAPTMTITPSSNPIHIGPVVGKVPSDAATRRLPAMDPAIARIGTIIAYRPISIANEPVRL